MLQMLSVKQLDSRHRQTENKAQGQHMLSMFINFYVFSPAGPACFLDVPWILIGFGLLLAILMHSEKPLERERNKRVKARGSMINKK